MSVDPGEDIMMGDSDETASYLNYREKEENWEYTKHKHMSEKFTDNEDVIVNIETTHLIQDLCDLDKMVTEPPADNHRESSNKIQSTFDPTLRTDIGEWKRYVPKEEDTRSNWGYRFQCHI